MTDLSRRSVLRGALAGAASIALPTLAREDLAPVYDQIGKRREETVRRIQQWIGQATIAAENVGGKEGAPMLIDLLRDAGFQRAERVETDGNPGVFAVLDAGAPKTLGLYFMYDVKQVDPKAWTSPLSTPSKARAASSPSTWCWWPKARRRSARSTLPRWCASRRSPRRSRGASASRCRPPRSSSTARSPSTWERRGSSSASWWPAARNGAAVPTRTSTPRCAPRWTARRSIWCRR